MPKKLLSYFTCRSNTLVFRVQAFLTVNQSFLTENPLFTDRKARSDTD